MAKDAPATLKQSNGSTVVSSALNPKTIRSLVNAGLATTTDPKNYSTCTLKTGTQDTAITNATAQNPVKLGIDGIRQVPTLYPEPVDTI